MIGRAAHLEVVAGNAAGMSILIEDELVIGRHAEGAGRLADDEEISRAHARVTVDEEGACEIEDLGSTNGTFVNALRISAPQRLSEGDTIELGATTLVVRELPTPESEDQASKSPPSLQPTVAGTAIPKLAQPPAAAPATEPDVQPPAEAADEFATQPYDPAEDLAAPVEPDPGMAPEAPGQEPAAPVEPDPAMAPEALAEEPAAPVEPEPLTPPDEPSDPPPPLRLRLEFDFANRAATIELDDESPPVQLVFDSGRWRVANPPD
jgi:predicted component of type VI protein secretion system